MAKFQYQSYVIPAIIAAAAAVNAPASDSGIPRAPKVTHVVSITGPVSVPTTFNTLWNPVYPDRVNRAAPRLEGFQVEPEFVPDVTNPVTPNSWTPHYPDRHTYRKAIEVPSYVSLIDPAGQFVDLSWHPSYPSRHVYRRPSEFPAWAAPLHVPDVTDPVPDLSWKSTFPDKIVKNILSTGQHPFFSWHSDTPVVVVTADSAAFGDFGQLSKTQLLQYSATVGPVSITTVETTIHSSSDSTVPLAPRVTHAVALVGPVSVPIEGWTTNWYPVYPDRHNYPQLPEFPSWVSPHFVPDVTQPVAGIEWEPRFPSQHTTRRLVEFPSYFSRIDFSDFVDLSWQPNYPSRHSYRRPTEFPAWTAPNFVPDVTQPVAGIEWEPEFPSRIPPKQALPGQAFFNDTFYEAWTTPPPPAPELSWDPEYPNRVNPRQALHVSRTPFWWMDRFDAPAVVTVTGGSSDTIVPLGPKVVHAVGLFGPVWTAAPVVFDPSASTGWNGVYPDFARGKVRLRTAAQQAWAMDRFDPPAPPPAFDPQYVIRGVYPDRLVRKFNRATYIQYQPMFGVIVQVPVMSWEGYTSLYPSRLPAKRRVPPPSFFNDTFYEAWNVPPPPAPELSWKPNYADRVLPKKGIHASRVPFWWMDQFDAPAFDPQYLPKVFYPDRVWPKKGLNVSAQVAFFKDPATEFDPKFYPQAYFPNRLDRIVSRQTAGQVGPVTIIPPLVTEWGPNYPVIVVRRVDSRNLPSGSVSPLIRNYVLVAETGIYLINGLDAGLFWSGAPGGGTNTRITFRLIVQDDEEDYFK